MIISRTPLRMSFVGGGSDLPAYYRRFGGAVVSTAIDKFVYITVNEKFDHRIRVSYSKTEEASSVARIKHPLVGESIGKQDQFAAAFGGFNFIEFNPDESVSVEPILCQRETLARLQENIIVF